MQLSGDRASMMVAIRNAAVPRTAARSSPDPGWSCTSSSLTKDVRDAKGDGDNAHIKYGTAAAPTSTRMRSGVRAAVGVVMDALSQSHLVLGPVPILRPRRDRAHRLLGRTWAVAMVVTGKPWRTMMPLTSPSEKGAGAWPVADCTVPPANVQAALVGRTGALMRNHGAVVVGDDLGSAYEKALQLEWVCGVYLQARAAGAVRVLPDDEIAGVVAQLASYGQTYRG